MSFDYFYGPDDAEQYSFYRIPKKLITGDEFQEISTEAKLLYGLMLDRLQLSIRNQWFDALNRVYIIYTVEDIMTDLHCGNQKACKMLAELENKIGLIKRKRQGLGKPSLIYVLKFSTGNPQNPFKHDSKIRRPQMIEHRKPDTEGPESKARGIEKVFLRGGQQIGDNEFLWR